MKFRCIDGESYISLNRPLSHYIGVDDQKDKIDRTLKHFIEFLTHFKNDHPELKWN